MVGVAKMGCVIDSKAKMLQSINAQQLKVGAA